MHHAHVCTENKLNKLKKQNKQPAEENVVTIRLETGIAISDTNGYNMAISSIQLFDADENVNFTIKKEPRAEQESEPAIRKQ